MCDYSEIIRKESESIEQTSDIPYGWTKIQRKYSSDTNTSTIVMTQNFEPELLDRIDREDEKRRQKKLYKQWVQRMVRYKMEDKEKNNEYFTYDSVLHEVQNSVEDRTFDGNDGTTEGTDSDAYNSDA